MIDVLYLSPHLDDVVLSCGGTLHQQSLQGKRVVILTVCTGRPSAGELSAFAQSLHARWEESAQRSAADMVALRKAEDIQASAVLKAETIYLDLPDCVYRRDPSSAAWMYESDAAIFGDLHSGDAGHIQNIAMQLAGLPELGSQTQVVVPLAVGQHVDHQLTRLAAEHWAAQQDGKLLYYEDFPYAEREGRLNEVLQPVDSWEPELQVLDEADLAARVAAITLYTSQLSTFWPDTEAMRQAVHDYTWRRGSFDTLAERFWKLART